MELFGPNWVLSGCLRLPRTEIAKSGDLQYSLGKRSERSLVSECAIQAQKWSKIATWEKVDFWVFETYY